MLFNSYVFILLFMPVTWVIYFFLNGFGCYRVSQVALVAASFIFYGYYDWRLCVLLLTTIVVNYAFHLILTQISPGILKKSVLAFGIFFNLALLFYFKYWNFAFEKIGRAHV